MSLYQIKLAFMFILSDKNDNCKCICPTSTKIKTSAHKFELKYLKKNEKVTLSGLRNTVENMFLSAIDKYHEYKRSVCSVVYVERVTLFDGVTLHVGYVRN